MMYKRTVHNKGGFVYMEMNVHRTVLYTGVTADLLHRSTAHHEGDGAFFPAKYNCTDLVYYEEHPTIEAAIAREKQLKHWKRAWKEALIRNINPAMKTIELI